MRRAHQTLAFSLNQRKCGRVRIDRDVEVRLRTDTGQAHYHGLARCGSWSACPVCSNQIAKHRGEEVTAALDAHAAGGGDVVLATMTLPHDYGDDLRELYEALAESFRFVKSGAPWKRWSDRLGFVGAIRGTDATVGPNGWHPHLHALLLFDRALTDDDVAQLESWLFERWARRLTSKHGIRSPSREHGVRLIRGQAAGYYVAKLGLGREITGMQMKQGRAGHRTPFQVLADWTARGAASDRELWGEWIEAMHGKVHLYWSPGLRARLLPDQDELTDEEIVAGEDGPEQHVVTIVGEVWDRIADWKDTARKILQAAERGGVYEVLRVIQLSLFDAPDEPSRLYLELQRHEDRVQHSIRWKNVGREAARESRDAGVFSKQSLRTGRRERMRSDVYEAEQHERLTALREGAA